MSTPRFSTNNSEHTPAKQPLRMMIVDDHEIVRHGLREVVRSITGLAVVAEANTCYDALKQIENTSIDLILVDLSLPDGNGMGLVHTLKYLDPTPHIIILSATIDDDLLLEAMLAGASGYLTKDVPANEIARLLQGFLRGEMVLTSPVASRLINLLIQKCQSLELSREVAKDETSVSLLPDEHTRNALTPFPPQGLESSPLSHLTPQEEKIFQFVRLGLSNKQIASQLGISRFTVGKHIQNILRKLGVANRTQVASYTSFEGARNAFDISKFKN